ncbi:transglycosylase SLT domain-containing protein [Candidatus Kuenenbacteria bacterium]|nr:transglycosylase SLT domain-containing protein [Candidatus Kuenenbacteria bacterium]
MSSFIEIKGQERGVVIEKIKNKAKELKIDENLVLALACCESKYKPYATSRPFEEKDEKGRTLAAQGIFQLTNPTIDQLLKNKNQYHFKISNSFNIEQNIEAGIRYLKWLFDIFYKEADQSIEKLIGAYNQSQKYFPPNESLDYSRLPTEEKQKEVKQITQCVLENKKRKNWKILFLPIFFFGIFFTPFGMWYLNQIDFFEPVVSEKEYLLSQVSSFPNIFLERDKNQIIFFNSQKKILKKISVKRLNIEKIFQIPKDFKEWNLIHLYPKLLQGPNNNFYFLAATSYTCGAQNCTWVLYKYNFSKDKLEIIDKNIFGSQIEFYPSLNFKKLALLSFYHSGYCNGKDYLEIINLDNFQKQEINKFHNDSFFAENIPNFNWENNEIIKFETKYYNCLNPNNNIEKNWIYDLKNQKLYVGNY